MQGLADGYFVLPYTIGDYLAQAKPEKVDKNNPAVRAVETEVNDRTRKLLSVKGKRTVDSLHRELGKIMWDECGMGRNAAGLKKALKQIPVLREEFWKNVNVPGEGSDLNQSLEKAGRVADFFELAELICMDALAREESCGGHFREEHQTEEGEAKRDDANFSHASVWEYTGTDGLPNLNKEPLTFEYVHPSQRSYK
jgi:succinate dehydrogenase / fumarate reductase flavoprotein subunit